MYNIYIIIQYTITIYKNTTNITNITTTIFRVKKLTKGDLAANNNAQEIV